MATLGLGGKLQYRTKGTTGEWTDIGDLVDIDVPTQKLAVPKHKTTTHATTGSHTYIPGNLQDTDDYNAIINWDNTVHTAVYALLGVEKDIRVFESNGLKHFHVGWVSAIAGSQPVEGVRTRVLTISVGGPIVTSTTAGDPVTP